MEEIIDSIHDNYRCSLIEFSKLLKYAYENSIIIKIYNEKYFNKLEYCTPIIEGKIEEIQESEVCCYGKVYNKISATIQSKHHETFRYKVDPIDMAIYLTIKDKALILFYKDLSDDCE